MQVVVKNGEINLNERNCATEQVEFSGGGEAEGRTISFGFGFPSLPFVYRNERSEAY